jgi:hypothetical protein
MKAYRSRAGFSLMEVNMAVFVMAVGILSMVALYPLGLRESTQGQADLKQSMFADYVLNQAVAAASQTNITWSAWTQTPKVGSGSSVNVDFIPAFIKNNLDLSVYNNMGMRKDVHYKIGCCLVPGASDKVMGIMVQSTDLIKTVTRYEQITNNPIYYAEVMFQGNPG